MSVNRADIPFRVLDKMRRRPNLFRFGLLAVNLWLAFGLRLLYARQISPFVDEYISMLAIRSIVEKGLPIMPSGLMYGPKALLHSYLGALFFWMIGPSEFAVRFLSVLAGVIAVALIYRVGRDWFSPAVGMASTVALAWLPSAVEWSGRARMYGLMQLLLLLGGYLYVDGYLETCNRRARKVGLFVLILAALTHTLALISVGALAVGVVVARWLSRKKRESVWPPSLWEVLAVLILIAVFGLSLTTRPWGPQANLSEIAPGSVDIGQKALYLVAFLHRFATWPFWPLTIFYAVGFINLISRWVKRSPEKAGMPRSKSEDSSQLPGDDVAFGLYTLLFFAWIATSASATLHDDRYLFGIIPFYLLLAFREIHLFSQAALASIQRPLREKAAKLHRLRRGSLRPWETVGSLGVIVALAIVLFAPRTLRLISHNTLDFVPAFEFVRDAWRPGDVIATCSPAPALLILGHTDYYLVQHGAEGESFNGRDVWTGSRLVNTPEGLTAVLNRHPRTWLVIEKLCLERRFDSHFQQFIGENMQIVFDQMGVLVFASSPL
jgi:4-amino-4-deoxy-L-arabinose transferase-like glycosyltransferase